MLDTILHNLENAGWAMLIFLCAYVSNMAFGLYHNIKQLQQPFDKERLINSGLKVASIVVGLVLLIMWAGKSLKNIVRSLVIWP